MQQQPMAAAAAQDLAVRNKMWEERYQHVMAESNSRLLRLTEQVSILRSEASDAMMDRAMCKMDLAEKIKAYLMTHGAQGYTSVYGLNEFVSTLVKGEKPSMTRKRNADGECLPSPPPQQRMGVKRCHSDEVMEEDSEQGYITPIAKRRAYAVSTPC